MDTIEIAVRAMPPPGGLYRRRIGRAFSREEKRLLVVEHPRPDAPDEISAEQYEALRMDPHIVAMPVGGADPQVLELRGKLAVAQEEIHARAKAQQDAAEGLAEDRRAASLALEEAGKRIQAAEAECDRLRGLLARKIAAK